MQWGYRSHAIHSKKVGGNMFFTNKDAATLKPELFERISAAFLEEPHLLPATAAELEGSFYEGLAMVGLTESGEPLFYCRLIPLVDDWYELGSTWAPKDQRGQGINKRAYAAFLPQHREKNILATTTNEASLRVGLSLGFVLCQRKALPEAVWHATCSCPSKKMGAPTARSCVLAWGELQHRESFGSCWLRITKPTAERLAMRVAA